MLSYFKPQLLGWCWFIQTALNWSFQLVWTPQTGQSNPYPPLVANFLCTCLVSHFEKPNMKAETYIEGIVIFKIGTVNPLSTLSGNSA